MRLHRSLFISLFGLITALPMAALAQAEVYPSRPVRFIIPAPPGGANDIIGRVIAAKLAERTGQPFVVDNRPGATGNVAAEIVVRAPADGYTLHVGNATIFIVNQYLFKGLNFNAGTDTVPAALMAQITNGLVVPGNSPFKSVGELLAYARANPGKLNYGSGGNGTTAHLFAELLKKRTGTDLVHVPFKGAGPMLTDLMAGRIDVAIENLPVILSPAKAGQVRILAVTSAETWPLAPELPTLQSQGVADFNVLSWFGLFLPAKTPRPVLEALNAHVNAVARDPDTVKRLEGIGARPLLGNLGEVSAFIERERKTWVDAVRASGAKVD
jgi:tripartite-type tricarboxylate transporter receptor subunit TctC